MDEGQRQNQNGDVNEAKTLTAIQGQGQTAPVSPTDHKYTEQELASLGEFSRRLKIEPPKIVDWNEGEA